MAEIKEEVFEETGRESVLAAAEMEAETGPFIPGHLYFPQLAPSRALHTPFSDPPPLAPSRSSAAMSSCPPSPPDIPFL